MKLKPIFITLMMLLAFNSMHAQSLDELKQAAKGYIKIADYPNAILVLTRASTMAPNDMVITRDLAAVHYYQNQYDKALPLIKKVIESNEADEQAYQIAGNIYAKQSQPKEAEKVYKKGIKAYPASGPLYCEYGEVLTSQQNTALAIDAWEKGIEKDAGYSKNYFNAAKYYYLYNNPLWSILYGEIFINMEPQGLRTPEIKAVVLDAYKKLFTNVDEYAERKSLTEFEKSVLSTLKKYSNSTALGVNTESLTMLRTKFVLSWFAGEQAKNYPYKLFETQQSLLKEGLFPAYNHWLFTIVDNLPAYQNWINLHKAEATQLSTAQKSRLYKQPPGQYYK